MSMHEDEFGISAKPADRYAPMPHKSGACVIDRARSGEVFCRIEVRDLDGGDSSTALARAKDIAAAFNRADSEQRWDRMFERANTPKALVKLMVDRFLAWCLPESFNPDGGIKFEPIANKGSAHEYRHRPVGTNLLDATQAEAMIRHLIDGISIGQAPIPGPYKIEQLVPTSDDRAFFMRGHGHFDGELFVIDELQWESGAPPPMEPPEEQEPERKPKKAWHVLAADGMQNLIIEGTQIAREDDWLTIFEHGDPIAWFFQPQGVRLK